jgi:hypothetical protein
MFRLSAPTSAASSRECGVAVLDVERPHGRFVGVVGDQCGPRLVEPGGG